MASDSRIKARGKWVDGLGPDTPTVEAARAFLSVRLAAVDELLPLAHERFAEDVEYVHQLRVATRRSDAALRTFQACTTPKRFRKMRRRLRRIRRAAAAARVCDVHGEIFKEKRKDCDKFLRPVLDQVLEWNAAERDEAQKEIAKAARRYREGKLKKSIGKLLKNLRDPAEAGHITLLDSAHQVFPGLIADMHAVAGEDMHVIENLHMLRLSGKRLRYAMEIFSPCFEPELRQDFYPLVQQVQDRLGDINDSLEIVHRLGRWLAPPEDEDDEGDLKAYADGKKKLAEGLIALKGQYQHQLEEQRQAFLEFWPQFGVDNLLNGLEKLLTREPVG